jgi:ribose 5-phosphate isomerase RpiB
MADQSIEIFVGSDHAGFVLKKQLWDLLKSEFPALKFEDCGSFD